MIRKTIIKVLILSLAAVLPMGQVKGQHFSHSYALVIGINRYQNPGKWPMLDFAPRRDAEAMAEYLRGQGFDVKTLYDAQATKKAITSWLEDYLAPRLGVRDRVLFFFSGHGETRTYAGEDHGYIVPYDGDVGASSWISMEKLRELSRKMGAARHQLFVFDSCFGGTFAMKSSLSNQTPGIPGYLARITSQKARQYLTAGGRGEEVRANGPKGYSYFTGHLLEALQEGKADTYPDGVITASELNAFLGPAASNEFHTPRGGTIFGHEQGDFIFRSPFRAQEKGQGWKLRDEAASGLLKGREVPGSGDEPEPAFTWGQRRAVQQGLNRLGFDAGPVDGVFGRKTRSAIARFQGRQGENPSGYLTTGQWRALLARVRTHPAPVTDSPEKQSSAQALVRAWRDPVTGIEFIRVPGGSYRMGCGPWTGDCAEDEKPVHFYTEFPVGLIRCRDISFLISR